MIIKKYNSGGRLFNYLAQGGRMRTMEEGGEMPEGEEVESTEGDPPRFKVEDGKLLQLQSARSGAYTENVNPEELFRYLNENRAVITPSGSGDATYAKELADARAGINEAVRSRDLNMLAEYIDPTKEGLDMIFPGFTPKETSGAENPAGGAKIRYKTDPQSTLSVRNK